MDSKRKVGAPKGRVRSDLQYKLFVYVSREVDLYVRRLAIKSNQSNSRIVDDLLKRVIKNARNASDTSTSKE